MHEKVEKQYKNLIEKRFIKVIFIFKKINCVTRQNDFVGKYGLIR